MAENLLEVQDLVKHFPSPRGLLQRRPKMIRAVDGVSFAIEKGTTFALVGESGCGKTTLAKLILLLEQTTRGSIRFQDQQAQRMRGKALREYKRSVQAVFQDPYSSLNPRMRVMDIVAEPLQTHEGIRGNALRTRVFELLEEVSLPTNSASLYPHEFSGGQRQRVAIARALALRPKLIVLDEPVSALDVSIRAQIINLLADLQERLGVSYLLISHDLAMVEHMSHVVAVMYLGKIVEMSSKDELYTNPQHPYTKALLEAVPQPDPTIPMRAVISGEVASPINPPSGCHFHPRCPIADASICPVVEPVLEEYGRDHAVSCHKVPTLP